MKQPASPLKEASETPRGVTAAVRLRLQALFAAPRSVEYSYATLGAAIVVASGVLLGGVLPFAIATLALVGGAVWVRSPRPKLSAFGVGTMVGSIAACWTGVEQVRLLKLGPEPGPWILGVYFILVGLCVGWMTHAVGQRMPLGDARSMAKKVAELLTYPTSILAAVVSFTVGVPAARTVVGNLTVGAVSAALAVGLGFWIGDQAAEHFHITRLGSDADVNPPAG